MAAGVIRLIRTPLLEGEPAYALGNIYLGTFPDGNFKGQRKPKVERLPQVLEDGRLLWEMPDNEENRKLTESFLPTAPTARFSFTRELPEDFISEDETIEYPGESNDTTFEGTAPPVMIQKRGRGRPRKDAEK